MRLSQAPSASRARHRFGKDRRGVAAVRAARVMACGLLLLPGAVSCRRRMYGRRLFLTSLRFSELRGLNKMRSDIWLRGAVLASCTTLATAAPALPHKP